MGLDKVIPRKGGKDLLNSGKFLTILVGFIVLGFAEITFIEWSLSILFFICSIGDIKTVVLFKKIESTDFTVFDTKYFIPLSFGLSL
ncbi:MAG: hypothetical protein DSZ04_05965 [Sulfurimonas sp.]|nr:MAG: hypothetical protein DSZ04_05965 [Sulfurimonas sp.]